jgi:hypothetical protein
MFRMDLLDALSDSELDQVEAYSQTLKKRRDEERKAKAMDEARAILAAAGINLEELNGRKKGRPAKASKKAGRKPLEAA